MLRRLSTSNKEERRGQTLAFGKHSEYNYVNNESDAMSQAGRVVGRDERGKAGRRGKAAPT
jgi:hypothetical protein